MLEKATNLYLVPADIQWSDVGSWDAVHDIAPKDAAGNSAQGNVLAFDCKDTLIRAGKRLVAAVGVEGVSVIETADAVLVAGRGASQDVRKVVDALAPALRPGAHRPHHGAPPLGRLHRARGRPRLQDQAHRGGSRRAPEPAEPRAPFGALGGGGRGGDGHQDGTTATLARNQSTYVPIGARHRLENRGTEPLHIIEVQCGDYLGEDDIRRYDDHYGRQAGEPGART